MLQKDDNQPSRSRLFKNVMSDKTVWLSMEVLAEGQVDAGIYTKRHGHINIRTYPDGRMTMSLVEEPA